MHSPCITESSDCDWGSHRAYGAKSLARTLNRGFTLGYFPLLPTGGTALLAPLFPHFDLLSHSEGSGGNRRGLALEIAEEPVEGPFVGIVVLPIAEIGDEVLANLAGRVLARIGVEALPIA